MTRPVCKKCGGKLIYESYPMEEMLAVKCFACGKIDSYRELTREESRKLFRRVDSPVARPGIVS